jgi:hypothetical protein
MRALDPEVNAIVWQAIEPLVPVPVNTHPLGRHRLPVLWSQRQVTNSHGCGANRTERGDTTGR